MNSIEGILFDFDGVLTDNRVWTDSEGGEQVVASKTDSLALEKFRRANPGFPLVVITSETNLVARMRCAKLDLEFIGGAQDKVLEARKWSEKTGINLKSCIFLCNDLNDFPLCAEVGWPIGVADCNPTMKNSLRFVLGKSGGRGAVSELLELVQTEIDDQQFDVTEDVVGPVFGSEVSIGVREWGREDLLLVAPGHYTMKKLTINKGKKGGLQRHRFKDEAAFLVKGKLKIRFDPGSGDLQEVTLHEGQSIRFPPGCVHQEEAITDCIIIECSTPYLNDRVRMEEAYAIRGGDQGLPTTSAFDVRKI